MKRFIAALLTCIVMFCLTACSVASGTLSDAVPVEGDSESGTPELNERLLPPAFPDTSSGQQSSANGTGPSSSQQDSSSDEEIELVGLWHAMNTASSGGYAERWYFSLNRTSYGATYGEFVRMASQLTDTPVWEPYQYGAWGYWGKELWLHIEGCIRADSEYTESVDGREVLFDANFLEIPNLSPVVETHTITTGQADAAGRSVIQIDGVTFYKVTDAPELMADYEEIRGKVRGYVDSRRYSDVSNGISQTVKQGSGVLEMGSYRTWVDGFPEGPLGSFYYIVVSPEDYAFYTGLKPGDYPPDRMLAVQIIAADSTGISLGDYLGELVTFTGEYFEAQTAHHRCAALLDVTQLTLVHDAGGYNSDPLKGLGRTLGEIRAEIPGFSYAGVVQYDYEGSTEAYAPPGDRTLRYLTVPNHSMMIPNDVANDFSKVGELMVCGIDGAWGQIYPTIEIASPKDIEALFKTQLEAGPYNGSGVLAFDTWSLNHNGLTYNFRVAPGESWGLSTRVSILLPVDQWDRQRQFAILESINGV